MTDKDIELVLLLDRLYSNIKENKQDKSELPLTDEKPFIIINGSVEKTFEED